MRRRRKWSKTQHQVLKHLAAGCSEREAAKRARCSKSYPGVVKRMDGAQEEIARLRAKRELEKAGAGQKGKLLRDIVDADHAGDGQAMSDLRGKLAGVHNAEELVREVIDHPDVENGMLVRPYRLHELDVRPREDLDPEEAEELFKLLALRKSAACERGLAVLRREHHLMKNLQDPIRPARLEETAQLLDELTPGAGEGLRQVIRQIEQGGVS